MHGYTWYGNNRSIRHTRARKGSGGVGILVKNDLFMVYDVKIIDKCMDGIIGICLTAKYTGHITVVFSCYLPPDNSPHAANVSDFFAHLTSAVYMHNNTDVLIICGDFNARVGKLNETITCDDIPERKIIDEVVSGHGEALIDFLIECKLCIIHGRISPDLANYTSVSTRGKAVVDYMFTRHDCLSLCCNAQVLTTTDLVDKFSLVQLISKDCKPPDHSVLMLCLKQLCVTSIHEERNDNAQPAIDLVQRKKFKFINIPDQFLNNDEWRSICNELVDKYIYLKNDQCDIDDLYQNFCHAATGEMDKFLSFRLKNKSGQNKPLRNTKPYWSQELSILWNDMKLAEKRFLKNRHDRTAHTIFSNKRKLFSKQLRKTERKFWHEQLNEIDALCTDNPRKFWNMIKDLGPKKRSVIPEKVYSHGLLIDDPNCVLETWHNEFSSMYNIRTGDELFENDFYEHAISMKNNLEISMCNPNYETNPLLNMPVAFQEIQFVVKNLKNNKSTGIDSIPYELMKYPDLIKIMFNMFSKCFVYGKIPNDWRKAIISPILKSGNRDPHIPMNYRGVSLLSCVCKGFTNILNKRLSSYYETSNILVDEQNGFRPNRSCIDHIFSLTTVIRNRLTKKQDTFACFIDFQKAFDFVNRDLLLYRLLLDKVDGNMYNVIKSIYSLTSACIRVNSKLTKWFDIKSGVRQGDSLSTTLFTVFINDLAQEINNLDLGIEINGFRLSSLLYADDIVIITNTAENLQKLIDCVNSWCNRWRMSINTEKTNIMHFRPKRCLITSFIFKFGDTLLSIKNQYKYLGIMLNEHLDYATTAELLSGAANRALGAIINKFRQHRNTGYKAFTKLYFTNVCPILEYCSGVWGFKQIQCCNKVQFRAQRYFLGVHNKTPLLSLFGDMGWTDPRDRRHLDMLRLWNRLIKMDNNRLTKKIFEWDKGLQNSGWNSEIKQIFQSLDCLNCFENSNTIDIKYAENKLKENSLNKWLVDVQHKPKLRTYVLFKDDLKTEDYVKYCTNREQRSLLAQFRFGTLQLNIELGRFRNIDLENRICEMCVMNVVENEYHFLCECPGYELDRQILYSKIKDRNNSFENLANTDKFHYIIKHEWKNLAKYLQNAWNTRSTALFE